MVKALKMHSMPPLPEDYLPRICSKLELSPKVEGAARDLLRAAQDVPLTNSVPISLAAAAVYIASIVNNERRKQKEGMVLELVSISKAYRCSCPGRTCPRTASPPRTGL